MYAVFDKEPAKVSGEGSGTMNSSLLRVDWYSFIVGTQISSVIGILTTSSYLGIRIRFEREFLYSTVGNNGNTVYIYRIKEPGNILKNGTRLLCKIIEKNIVAGAMYMVIEKFVETATEENIMKAFICGGMLGLYSCFSFNYYDLQDTNIWQILLCWLASAEVSALLEEIKILFTLDEPISFVLAIPFENKTFWNGAIVSTLVGIEDSNFLDNLDGLFLPEIEDTDSNWNIIQKCLQFFRDCCYISLKLSVGVSERLLAGGIIQSGFELLIKHVTGLNFSLPTGVMSACLYGFYVGMASGNVKRGVNLSWKVVSILRIMPWICVHAQNLALPTNLPPTIL